MARCEIEAKHLLSPLGAQTETLKVYVSLPARFPARPSRTGSQIRDRKINLPFKLIYPGDVHAQLIAHGEAAAALPSNETALAGREHIEVIRQGRDVDQTGQQNVW